LLLAEQDAKFDLKENENQASEFVLEADVSIYETTENQKNGSEHNPNSAPNASLDPNTYTYSPADKKVIY
jgi:hypothetical protein